MKGLLLLGQKLWLLFLTLRRFLPRLFVGFFVLFHFISVWRADGLTSAFTYLSTTFLAAELAIRDNTLLAVENSPAYGLPEFLAIVNSLIILFFFVRLITWALERFTGSQARGGAYLMSVVIIGIIEFSTVRLVSGSFDFIPVVDGLWFLLVNLGPVFSNIQWLPSWLGGGYEAAVNETGLVNQTTAGVL